MCLICDGYTEKDVLGSLELSVVVNGWAIQGVETKKASDSWAYSVGLTDFGLPELVVTNMKLLVATDLINDCASQLLLGKDSATAAAALNCRMGQIDVSHIENGLIAMWIEFYLKVRGKPRPSGKFLQLIPGEDYYCSSHEHRLTDLSIPAA